jgi:hypothetical protein
MSSASSIRILVLFNEISTIDLTNEPDGPPDQRCAASCLGAAHRLSTGKPLPLRRKTPRVTADARPRPAAVRRNAKDRALELLVKQKRLAKTAPVPCIVSEVGGRISAEEDSLAENVHRVALHPLDQFRAFQTLREQGRSEEDIAAIFFVSVNVVKQRLRLAAVSPKLLDVYADDGMSLEQLMAFSVTADHPRQEQVWENVNKWATAIEPREGHAIGVPDHIALGIFPDQGPGWLEMAA